MTMETNCNDRTQHEINRTALNKSILLKTHIEWSHFGRNTEVRDFLKISGIMSCRNSPPKVAITLNINCMDDAGLQLYYQHHFSAPHSRVTQELY